MHGTAIEYGKLFFDVYVRNSEELTIVDIGSQDVNGSLRSVAPSKCEYIGVDFSPGKGVDVILDDPYVLPFPDNSVDICVSSSCFEHSEFFWLVFLEIMRILSPKGLFYLNAPSNGDFHSYPVDCWRFYPDSGIALQNWGRRNGFDPALLESFTGKQERNDVWNDYVAVFVKDRSHAGEFTSRMQDRTSRYTNGRVLGKEELSNFAVVQEDQLALSRRVRTRLQQFFHRSGK